MLDAINRACIRWEMRISWDKTNVLSIGEPPGDHPAITLKSQAREEVDSSYLGSEIEQMSRAEKDVKIRIEKAATVCQMWRKKVFRSGNLSRSTKVQVFRAMVMLVLLYGAETWTVTQQDIRRLKTFQMRCLQDIVGVTLWDMWRNVDILEETTNQRAAGTEEAPVVRTPAEDARQSITEATAAVQTERKEEAARGDLLAVGGCHQQRPD